MNRWTEIEILYNELLAQGKGKTLRYDKPYMDSLIANSAAYEARETITVNRVRLFPDGLTEINETLLQHPVTKDLGVAYNWATKKAAKKAKVSPEFLREMNATIMKSTGRIHECKNGEFNSKDGDYRLRAVYTSYGKQMFAEYTTIPRKIMELCDFVMGKINSVESLQEKYELSFQAHLDLVKIHPWADSNGRTARLLTNYIQMYFGLLPAKYYLEDRQKYMDAIKECQVKEINKPFMIHMATQLHKSLKELK